MQMNPQYYYDNFVTPNYEEFCADHGSIRKAFNAVISLASMTDNYFNYYERRKDSRIAPFIVSAKKRDNMIAFKNHLSNISSYFNDLQSMANAYRHLYTNSGKAYVTVASGGAVYVEEVTENDDSIDNVDLKGASCCIVYYSKKDGSSLEVKDALTEVMKVWGNLL